MKGNKKWLSLLVIAALMTTPTAAFAEGVTSTVASTVKETPLAVGKVYEGFKLVKKVWSEEAASNILYFEHVKNGGKVLYFENEDKHKSFDIVFKTPVYDNTGVNHILEHGVLSGSEKYPSKSPFMTVAQTSVNTFANALTYPDKTAYPFSSQNDKDFQNLLSVYMDAVFAPKIIKDQNLFKREGWGYDFDAKSNKLGYKGIVYSEMKGSMSDPGSLLYSEYQKNLFPQTKFAFNSGGNPEVIVTLTHQKLVDTYKQYYHPSNALMYLYGKMDIVEKLKFINKEYYSKYEKKSIAVDYGTQKPFDKTKYAVANYHVDSGTDLKGKTMHSIGFGVKNVSKKDLLGLNLLVSLMTNLEISPMKQAFKASGLGQTFNGSLHLENKATSIEFSTSDSDMKQKAAFENFVNKQLLEISKAGLNKELITAALNSVELSNRLGKLSTNKGNGYRDVIEIGYVTYNDPLYFFDLDTMVNDIKQSALNDRYFEKLIDKYMIKNTHKLVLSVEPKVNHNKDMEQRQAAVLSKFQKSLTPKALADLKASIAAFDKWKNEPDTAANLAKLPTLHISDLIYKVAKGNQSVKEVQGIKILKNEANTNKTAKINYYFNMDALTPEELKAFPLYIATFSVMGTTTKDLSAITNEALTYTTGVTFNKSLITGSDYYTYKGQKAVLSATCLESNIDQTMALMNDMALNHVYDQKDMLKYLVDQSYSGYEYYLMNNADDVAWDALSKNLTAKGQLAYAEQKDILAYYKNLSDQWETEAPKLIARFGDIQKKLLNKNGLVVSVTAEAAAMPTVEKNVEKLLKGLKNEVFEAKSYEFKPGKEKTALTLPSQVQYVYKGFNANQTGGKITGSSLVFAQLMNNEYFYPMIRVQGGAYGGSMSASLSGNVVFTSYRDPGLSNTVKVIDDSVKFLKALKLTQEQINPYINSVLGEYDAPLSVFDLAATEDSRFFSGITLEQEEKLLKEIASTTPEDLKAFIELLEKGLPSASLVVSGSEGEIQKNKGLFDLIKKSIE